MRRLTISKALLAGLLMAMFPLTPALSVSTPAATPGQAALNHLKTKGATEIDRRVQNLQAALDKLNSSTKLTASDKSALATQVNAELTGLKALKDKLAADTTVAGARTDVQSIITDYRVYLLMLPKVRMIATLDRFNVAEDKLIALHAKLETKVAASTDPTLKSQLEGELSNMNNAITDAKTKTAGLVTALLALQPADYNANHAVLVNDRAAMKTAQGDLKQARDLAKSVIDSLKTGGTSSKSPAASSSK